jgi:DNA ligase-1
MIYKILNEIANTAGTNAKVALLKQHKDNELLKRVFSMALDKVKFSYGIRKIPNLSPSLKPQATLTEALDFMEFQLATRKLTGNTAIQELGLIMMRLSQDDFNVIRRVIERDLKCGLGKTHTNSVWSGLVTKPPYMRCGTFTAQTSQRITYPALLQLKCDGRYVSVMVDSGTVTFTSRSGEEQEFPELAQEFLKLSDGVYMGELLVDGIEDRAIANGMINSSEPPQDKIYCVLWDVVTISEFSLGSKTPYNVRFQLLKDTVSFSGKVKVVDYVVVVSKEHALEQTSIWMSKGFEGSVLKDKSLPFKNHTSPLQLKIKLKCEADVEIASFIEGNAGSKNEAYFSAIAFKSSDGKIQGQVGVTSMTEATRNSIFLRKDTLIGSIMVVQFNDITIASGSQYYALSHPRYVELRGDKDVADDFTRIKEMVEMAKCL